MKVLIVLERQKESTMGEVAKALSITRPTATQLVDRLVRRGLVLRIRSSADRRQVHLTLSSHGRELMEEFARKRQVRFEKLFRVLHRSEVRRLVGALKDLNDIFGKWAGP